MGYACSTIAAHPSKPNQIDLGLRDGRVLTVEPRQGDWPGRPHVVNEKVKELCHFGLVF